MPDRFRKERLVFRVVVMKKGKHKRGRLSDIPFPSQLRA